MDKKDNEIPEWLKELENLPIKDFKIKIKNEVVYNSNKDLFYQMGYGRYPGGGVYEYSKKPLSEMIGKPEDINHLL